MNIYGVVRHTGGCYRDGLERWEIYVGKSQAKDLPYKEGGRVQVLLAVGDESYYGYTRATKGYENVWISPILYADENRRTTLARVLVDAEFERNQRVQLSFDGNQIRITHSDVSHHVGQPKKVSGGSPMAERVFGEVHGYPEWSSFASRRELSQAGVHTPTQAGISGSQSEGADSIVLSGGYEDDDDTGDTIVYTGHGGRDPVSGRQITHQMLVRGNKALALSRKLGLPVRVVRGSAHASPFSPRDGYRYDGLYRVEDHWKEQGQSGFDVWRFRLVKIPPQVAANPPDNGTVVRASVDSSRRTDLLTSRIIRDTQQTQRIKALYDYRCQICSLRLEGNAGPYAEAAHIRPLGKPHNGPDVFENLLCLCPNHHVLFDYGGVAIADDYSIIGESGRLAVNPNHKIDLRFIRCHRERYGFDASALQDLTN
jgi:putative restriction endonuclease